MKTVKTIQEAKALPERSRFGEIREVQSDGAVLITSYFKDLVAVEWEDDSIIGFVDDDGVSKTVEYDSDGAYKTPF